VCVCVCVCVGAPERSVASSSLHSSAECLMTQERRTATLCSSSTLRSAVRVRAPQTGRDFCEFTGRPFLSNIAGLANLPTHAPVMPGFADGDTVVSVHALYPPPTNSASGALLPQVRALLATLPRLVSSCATEHRACACVMVASWCGALLGDSLPRSGRHCTLLSHLSHLTPCLCVCL
jgi:hypothetical protein